MSDINVNKALFQKLIDDANAKKAEYDRIMGDLKDLANNRLSQYWGGNGYYKFKPSFDSMANQLDERFGDALETYIDNMTYQLQSFEEADQQTAGLF